MPGTKLAIAADLKEGDTWTGTIDIPAQMLRGFALSEVKVEGEHVMFEMPDIPGEPAFDGKLSNEGAYLTGDFHQNGQTFPFALERRAPSQRSGETLSHGVPGKGLVGHWQGSLRPGSAPVELRLALQAEPVRKPFGFNGPQDWPSAWLHGRPRPAPRQSSHLCRSQSPYTGRL